MRNIILMALEFHPGLQGGIQTFCRNLKKMYPKELKIISKKRKEKKSYEVDGVIEVGSPNIIFRILNKLSRQKLLNFLIKRSVNKNLEDIIVFNHPEDLERVKDIDSKRILVQHTGYDMYMKWFCKDEETKRLIEEKIDILITLSPYDKKKFEENFKFSPSKVKVIRHTCDVETLQLKKEKKKKLIMIARIENMVKRFDLAIKAMKKLPDFILEIYGNEYKKEDMDFLKNIIKENNISNVFFMGETIKVQEVLDSSGIFIMTSDFEGYPITLIEAMRRGLPIILRNTFEAAEDIVIENGVLLEKEWNEDKFVEAVKKVYENYEYYSENSKKLGERHSPEIIKKEWDKLFEEIEIGERK